MHPSVQRKAFLAGPVLPAGLGRVSGVQRREDVHAFETPKGFLERSGPGDPLPTGVKQRMERYFGADFSDVRVHVGPEARSIGALAFTLGSDIYFSPEHYRPGTRAGQELLGHELTHVVQQREGRVSNPFGDGVAVVQDFELEAEADRHGKAVAQGRLVSSSRRSMRGPVLAKARLGRSLARRPSGRAAQRSTFGKGKYVSVFGPHRDWYGKIDVEPEQDATHYDVRVGGTDRVVRVDRKLTALHPSFVKPTTWEWSTLHHLRPGIAVELSHDEKKLSSGKSYVALIRGLIAKMEKTPIGREILVEFDPRNPRNTFNQIDGGARDGASAGFYAGLTVIIQPPSIPLKKTKFTKTPEPLKTGDFFGVDAKTGRRYHPNPMNLTDDAKRVPVVTFWDVTQGSFDNGSKVITDRGIEKHPDIPQKWICPLETALFHELCHAFLFQVGISKYVGDAPEENFVSGLGPGIGWKYSENTYRAQAKQPLRLSYVDVKLMPSEDPLHFDWGDNDKHPAVVLEELGLEKAAEAEPWKARTRRWD